MIFFFFFFGTFHLPSVSSRCLFVSSAKHAETALYTKLTSDKRSLFPAWAPWINNGNNDFVGFLLPSGVFSNGLGALRTDARYFSPSLESKRFLSQTKACKWCMTGGPSDSHAAPAPSFLAALAHENALQWLFICCVLSNNRRFQPICKWMLVSWTGKKRGQGESKTMFCFCYLMVCVC